MRSIAMGVGITFLIAIALPALAEYPADYLGLFFDLDANSYCESIGPFQSIELYLLYLNPTVTSISGYEVGIEIPGDLYLVSAATPFGEFVGNLGQIGVECTGPISCEPVTLLFSLRVQYWGGWDCLSPTHFSVGASSAPSHPVDGPFVILQDGSTLALHFDSWAAFLDPGCDTCIGLATEESAWGNVKALYR